MAGENDDPAYNAKMASRNSKARGVLSRCGYKSGGKVKAMKAGGAAEGAAGRHKADAYASGGSVKGGKKGVTVNVMVAPSQQQPEKIPVPMPAPGGGAPPPRPPMGPPPPGGGMMPPGGMPPRPPMKSGGRVKQLSVKGGGAGGGDGRLEKAKLYGGK